jgi:hypothetical protein
LRKRPDIFGQHRRPDLDGLVWLHLQVRLHRLLRAPEMRLGLARRANQRFERYAYLAARRLRGEGTTSSARSKDWRSIFAQIFSGSGAARPEAGEHPRTVIVIDRLDKPVLD